MVGVANRPLVYVLQASYYKGSWQTWKNVLLHLSGHQKELMKTRNPCKTDFTKKLKILSNFSFMWINGIEKFAMPYILEWVQELF